jgi:hypothetical protein
LLSYNVNQRVEEDPFAHIGYHTNQLTLRKITKRLVTVDSIFVRHCGISANPKKKEEKAMSKQEPVL